MGEALFNLEQVLRSRQEKLTSQEANILLACKAQAMRDFTIGFGGASVFTWLVTPLFPRGPGASTGRRPSGPKKFFLLSRGIEPGIATRRLGNLFRFNVTLGAAAICGLWKFGRSLDSCVEHILSLEGSRMQKELANLLLRKYPHDPWVRECVSKHFYSEKVYDDSSADQPKVRWRFRNCFGDNLVHTQTTSDSDKADIDKNTFKKTSAEVPKNYMNAAADGLANPFDCVFGLPAIIEEIPRIDTSSTLSKRQRRIQKRSHRRHRKLHQEVSNV